MKPSSVIPLCALAALTAVVFAANISIGLWHGRLSAPPTYDDVGYLFDAFQRYYFHADRSLLSAVGSFFYKPPHSPLSTAVAMVGYAVAGPRVISPYLANIAAFSGFAAFLYWLARPLSLGPRFFIAATALFLPAAHVLINEFRPDMTAGMLFAIAIYFAISLRPERHSRAALFGLGIFLTFAATAKPSSIVICVPIVALAAVIGIARSMIHNVWREAVRLWAPVIAGGGFAFTPFMVIFGSQTIAYIYDALVTNADVWKLDGSAYFHWTFHSFGAGGSAMLGLFFWPLLAAIFLDMVRAAVTRTCVWPSFGYAGILTLIYLGMAANPSKTVYQGCFFYFPFAIAGFAAVIRLLSINARFATPISALVFVCTFTVAPMATSYVNNRSNDVTKQVVDEIVRQVSLRAQERDIERCPQRPLSVSSIGVDPTTARTIALAVGMSARIEMKDTSSYTTRNEAEAVSKLAASDFVVLPAPEHVAQAIYKLPTLDFADGARNALSQPGWRVIKLPMTKGGIGTFHIRMKC